MKTAITVLQELVMKYDSLPEYKCPQQKGPEHLASFQIVCTALEETGIGTGRSKKEAKQEAARLVLYSLSRRGYSVPSPFHLPDPAPTYIDPTDNDPRCYVALMRELAEEYRLPPLEYEIVGDSGVPHARAFTVRVAVGGSSAQATATTKKAARQAATEVLYHFVRKYCAYTHDFVESEALVRAIDKERDRFVETRTDLPPRPDLSRVVSQDYLNFNRVYDEPIRYEALAAMDRAAAEGLGSEEQLTAAAQVLKLQTMWITSKRRGYEIDESAMHTVQLSPTEPQMMDVGTSREQAAARLIAGLRLSLQTFRHQPKQKEHKPPINWDD